LIIKRKEVERNRREAMMREIERAKKDAETEEGGNTDMFEEASKIKVMST
jgi:hypothetical protein